jgi:hypothetical protein
MQHRSPCEAGLDCCEGRIEDCPECGDQVCELHAVDGLCLACQGEEEEEIMPAPSAISKKQYDLFVAAIATAKTLLATRIEELTAKNWSTAMYEGWLAEAEQANQEIIALGIKMPASEWLRKEVA